MEKKTEPLIKLKPCPFCGGLAILIKVEKNIFTPNGSVYIICNDCNIQTEEYETDELGTALDKAVSAWNKRV